MKSLESQQALRLKTGVGQVLCALRLGLAVSSAQIAV
jgi:hypothetical protein